jgi:heavy metal sensor kinase
VNFYSLRFKLVWIHGIAIGLAMLCIGLTRYQLVSYRSQKNFDAELLSDGKLFCSKIHSEKPGFHLSLEGLNFGDSGTIRELEPLFVMTDLKGNVIAAHNYSSYMQSMLNRGDLKAALLKQSGFSNVIAFDRESYRFVHFKSNPGLFPQPAVIHLGRGLDSLDQFLSEYRLLYLYSIPLILIISWIVGWFLTGRALGPYEEITRTAEKITFENLNMQITTKHKEEEVQRLVQAFNSMVKRLNESFRNMREFNANVAHELRTPLAILQGETEVAFRTPNLPEEIQSVLISNLEELDRLKRLVNDMLILAEAEAGRLALSKEPINLKLLLFDLIEQMRLLATDRNIQIELIGPAELWIEADNSWIRRALVNLLDNAIKYSKDGGKIEVSAAMKGSFAELKIMDDGIGISPEDIPRIFDRLYRADRARSRVGGGSGLGLALVKWIIEAHKGSIHVESKPDMGASFEIELPVKS